MTTRQRRTAGTPATWGELTTEAHGGQPLVVRWPWAPDDSVTVTFLERGYLAGTVQRELTPATYDDDGAEVTPAEVEVVERWVHYADHPEWGRNAFELDADHAVEVGE